MEMRVRAIARELGVSKDTVEPVPKPLNKQLEVLEGSQTYYRRH
jgi:hypothetical protein